MKQNSLILFTMRTGSTIFSDLKAYSAGGCNLGEGLTSRVRDYNYSKKIYRNTDFYKTFIPNLQGRHYGSTGMFGGQINFFEEKNKRATMLFNNLDYDWVIKEMVDKHLIDLNIIRRFIECKHVNIYMTYRRDLKAQFISYINAYYRNKIDKQLNGGFIFQNNEEYVPYSRIEMDNDSLFNTVNRFLNTIIYWRSCYEVFKEDIILVNYEDHIKPMKLRRFGITERDIREYNNLNGHLVKTPANVEDIYITNDDAKQKRWQDVLYLIDRHQEFVNL